MIDPYTMHDPFATMRADNAEKEVKRLAKVVEAMYTTFTDELVTIRQQNIELLRLIIELQGRVSSDVDPSV